MSIISLDYNYLTAIKQINLMRKFSEVARYKINIQNLSFYVSVTQKSNILQSGHKAKQNGTSMQPQYFEG